MMESQSIFNASLGVASLITGWFARELWAAVKELKADLAKLSTEIPKTYVTRDDYRQDLKEIRDLLAKIFDKLDGKVDR
jgi:septal ring factor EnvC (AmiA/AmiB activator)